MKRLVLAAAVLYASASLASAQSLVEVAKKEKERRKKIDADSKQAFTETDLRRGPRLPPAGSGSGSTAAEPGQAAPAAGVGETPAAEEQDPTKTESYWRERLSTVNKKIQDLEAKLQNPELTSDTRGASRRQAAERELEQARGEKQALTEEARRKGVPPGWLR